jgi:hypothetical protein
VRTRSARAFGLYPVTNRRVPHISLVFREMWDTAGLASRLAKAKKSCVQELKPGPGLFRSRLKSLRAHFEFSRRLLSPASLRKMHFATAERLESQTHCSVWRSGFRIRFG